MCSYMDHKEEILEQTKEIKQNYGNLFCIAVDIFIKELLE